MIRWQSWLNLKRLCGQGKRVRKQQLLMNSIPLVGLPALSSLSFCTAKRHLPLLRSQGSALERLLLTLHVSLGN